MSLSALFKSVVTHPIAVVMMTVAAVVFGGVSYLRLPVELMPDMGQRCHYSAAKDQARQGATGVH